MSWEYSIFCRTRLNILKKTTKIGSLFDKSFRFSLSSFAKRILFNFWKFEKLLRISDQVCRDKKIFGVFYGIYWIIYVPGKGRYCIWHCFNAIKLIFNLGIIQSFFVRIFLEMSNWFWFFFFWKIRAFGGFCYAVLFVWGWRESRPPLNVSFDKIGLNEMIRSF